jgi:N-acetylgalactosamine-6-sulfatase
MLRLLVFPAVFLGGLTALSARAGDAPAPAAKPNIIFILLDDQGWGDAGSFGHPYMKTPAIDRLVREGARFTQFYVANPVCSPSRTAFLTGHFPARHGIHQHLATSAQNAARGMPDWLDPKVVTVCDLLKKAGYATAHFGKWHLGAGAGAPDPSAYGFDEHRTVNSSGPNWGAAEKDEFFRAKSTGLFVDETIRFLKAHRGRPCYVNLWTLVPHALLHPTPEELAVYKDLRVDPQDFSSWMRQYVRDAKNPAEQMRVFCAAMTGLDRSLGRLLDFLDAEGLAQNTLIVFSSDNGPEDYHIGNAANAGVGSPGPLRARKRSLYEGGIRTPLIVRWPGKVRAGRVDDATVLASVDFLPTVCKLAGVELPELRPDGEDMSDVLLGQSRARQKPLFWEWRGGVAGNPDYRPPRLAVRDGRWKLFCDFDGGNAQLYDVPADPEERSDLAAEEPAVVARLKKQALAWKQTLPQGPVEPPAIGKPKPVAIRLGLQDAHRRATPVTGSATRRAR